MRRRNSQKRFLFVLTFIRAINFTLNHLCFMYIKKFEHFFQYMIIKILSHQNFFSEKKLIFKNAAFNLLVKFI